MRIHIEVEEHLSEEEVIIRCPCLNDTILKIQQAIASVSDTNGRFAFYKGETAYYLPLDHILFFETEGTHVLAHTASDLYETKYKLYELEEVLPGHFMRISKSSILNVNRIYSITKNLSSSSLVEFQGTHKQIFVSRHYYRLLKAKLEEKRSLL